MWVYRLLLKGHECEWCERQNLHDPGYGPHELWPDPCGRAHGWEHGCWHDSASGGVLDVAASEQAG
ncbi:hypothetical protein BN2475_240029 [Paraburkholderia ribeironis]|uniref:Uncharacterized protein n=1 Tax=Paraburkholderia ribeironis TaxID=1247936 RepID=A0A1N7RY91_9BURK|nr:hypothetical protein BN2475_240029 [Paraburkholderia ribeironis]